MFQKNICPPWCKIQNYYLNVQSMGATPAPSLELIKWRGQKILSRQHSWLSRVGWDKGFDLDIWTLDLKINWDHLLIEGNPCTKFGTDQVKGSKDIKQTTHWAQNQEWFDLDLWTCDMKINRDHLLIWVQPLHQVRHSSSERVKRYWVDNTVGREEWFDLDFWTCDLKINKDHLLIEGNHCTKFGIDQVKGSKDIERTTLGLQTDRPTDQPTYQPKTNQQLQINMTPFSREHKNKIKKLFLMLTDKKTKDWKYRYIKKEFVFKI